MPKNSGLYTVKRLKMAGVEVVGLVQVAPPTDGKYCDTFMPYLPTECATLSSNTPSGVCCGQTCQSSSPASWPDTPSGFWSARYQKP